MLRVRAVERCVSVRPIVHSLHRTQAGQRGPSDVSVASADAAAAAALAQQQQQQAQLEAQQRAAAEAAAREQHASMHGAACARARASVRRTRVRGEHAGAEDAARVRRPRAGALWAQGGLMTGGLDDDYPTPAPRPATSRSSQPDSRRVYDDDDLTA